MNTIISKLEQDDRILAELDNQLRSVSTRRSQNLVDTNNNSSNINTTNIQNGSNKNTNKSTTTTTAITITTTTLTTSLTNKSNEKLIHSLPSLNSSDVHEWKFQDYQSVLNTTDQNRNFQQNEHEKTRKISNSNTSSISNELKRIEENLAAVRSGNLKLNDHYQQQYHETCRAASNRISNLTQEHGHDILDKQPKPLISAKTSTKIESYLDNEKTFNFNNKKQSSNVSSKDLDLLMEKLERDNKILAELDKKLKNVSTTSNEGTVGQLSSSLPSYTTTNLPKNLVEHHHISKSSNPLNPNNPSVLYSNRSSTNIVSRNLQQQQESYSTQIDELKEAEEIVDSIELPNRGRCKVFMARYNYDPYKHSPNDNPETEVTLLAGDFILVFGTIDEDGYYYGELLDGRRGLVPSNFIEKLTGDDLFEFQARVLYGHNKEVESDSASFPPEFYDAILSEQIGHTSFQHLLAPDDFHRINDYIDLEDATEIDEDVSEPERAEQEAAKTTVPPPQRLIVERQLHKSVLIGWLHPECPRIMIDHYKIYVDGVLKATIPSGDRTKALVEGVDSSMPHRISIRAIDRNGRYSKDPGCTIVIGKNIPFAPCCVKASNITSDSALISWIPCNSNFYHVVAVNSVEVRTVKPSTYKHLIVGLSANTLYRVSVRAKPGKLLCSDEKNPKKLEMLTTFVDFRTLPKSLPDPPVDIQVEAGPQEGTLLVTWLPITLNQFGTSNNCPVTGYAVFAGHKKLAEIDSPTGDHALLDIASLEHLHKKQITVRTKSGENLSQDSMPCQIPDDLLKLPLTTNNSNQPLKRTQILSDSESETDFNRLMHNVARRSKEFEIVSQQQCQEQRTFDQNTPYELRHRMMATTNQRQSNVAGPNRRVASNRNVNVANIHATTMHINDNATRMTIPAIEITKETPSESVQPLESYSEEEFDQSMKQRVYSGKRSGVSPMPPQRTRILSEYERSNLGPYNQLMHRRPQNVRDREHGVRWFVALFDYDPMTMSPNPDAAEEELPFQEGQLIKIYGDKDADGFYRGECNGRIGYVPCNMVSEVQYDVENDPRYRNNPNDSLSHLSVRKMIALYDYDPQELSPNFDTETELAFRTGDIIYVYGDMDEDGFYIGEANGMRGLVPSNFLADAGPVEPSNVRHAKMLSATGQMVGQQPTRQLNPSNTATMGMAHGQVMQSQIQVPGTTQVQQQYSNQQTMSGAFNQTTQNQFSGTTQNQMGLFQTNAIQQQQQPQQQMLLQQQTQQQPIQQQQVAPQYQQTGNQLPVTGTNQQQMFQTQQTTFQQQTQATQQQPLTQQQQQSLSLQSNQSMARIMRPQNPMLNVGGQQGQYNPMFQGPGTNLGNKQRPNSLDLNIGTPRFGQQITNQSGFSGPIQQQQTSQLQLPQQQQQQQQSTGMLGSLFASGKKILEEATTPLGARGPFAHPNQPHQPMMGHHQPQGAIQNQPPQSIQQTQMGFGQPQQQTFNPMMTGQANQPGQPSGTILNTMKNIFKL